MRAGDGAVDEQRLGGAAHADAAHLGVDGDPLRHVEIGGGMNIDVADALEMGEHRHARLHLDAADQALAAARHDHIDGAVEPGEHQPDGGAVAGRHHLDRFRRQAGLGQTLDEAAVDGARGTIGVGAAAQDRGIARLEAERPGIGGHVRPALIDDADHAERRAHALDVEAVGAVPAGDHRPDRVGESLRSPRSPAAIASIRFGVSVKRSMNAAFAPSRLVSARSRRFRQGWPLRSPGAHAPCHGAPHPSGRWSHWRGGARPRGRRGRSPASRQSGSRLEGLASARLMAEVFRITGKDRE